MPYRDAPHARAVPSVPAVPLWERLYIAVCVAAAPWLLPALIVRDAQIWLELARLPAALDTTGRARLIARLRDEAPLRVRRAALLEHTMASGEDELWHVLVVQMADGEHVVASAVGGSDDHVAPVLGAILAHRTAQEAHSARGAPRALIDEELRLEASAFAVVYTLAPVTVWALALAISLGPLAAMLAVVPLPAALVLRSLARGAARRVRPPR